MSIDTSPVKLGQITPTPTEEEVAAIVAALTLAWPQPVIAVSATNAPSKTAAWKWSGRSWASSPLPAGARRRP